MRGNSAHQTSQTRCYHWEEFLRFLTLPLLFLLIGILLSINVLAVVPADSEYIMYNYMDGEPTPYEDYINSSFNMEDGNSPDSCVGINGDCLDFVRANNDYIDSVTDAAWNWSTDMTFGVWVNPDSLPNWMTIWAINLDDAGLHGALGAGLEISVTNADQFRASYWEADINCELMITDPTVTYINGWHLLIVEWNISNNRMHFYVNGTLVGTSTDAQCDDRIGKGDQTFFGAYNGPTWLFDGQIDDAFILEGVGHDIAAIWNSSSGYFPGNPGGVVGGPNRHIIIVNDLGNGEALEGATVTLNGSTNTTNTAGTATFWSAWNQKYNYNVSITGYWNDTGAVGVNTTSTMNISRGWFYISNLYTLEGDPIQLNINTTLNVSTNNGTTYVNVTNTTPIYLTNNSITVFNSSFNGYWDRAGDSYTATSLPINGSTTMTGLSNLYLAFVGSYSGDTYTPYCTDGSTAFSNSDEYYGLVQQRTQFECTGTGNYPAFDFNITLSRNQTVNTTYNVTEYTLILNFSNETSGVIWWTDQDGTINNDEDYWWNSTLVYATVEFCDGTNYCYVTTEFNRNDSGGAQYYEFYNTYQATEEAEVYIYPENALNTFFYIQVVGVGNNPLENVRLEAHRLGNLTEEHNYTLIGQRYSNADGMQTFYFNDDDTIMIVATMGSYAITVDDFRVNEFINVTRDDPYKIELTDINSQTVFDDIFFAWPYDLNNDTTDVGFWIYSKYEDYYDFNTSEYGTLTRVTVGTSVSPFGTVRGLPNTGVYTLTRGTHYDPTQDLTIYWFDEDGDNVFNWTIPYVNRTERTLTASLGEISGAFRRPFLLILLLVFAITIGAYVNREQGSSGFHTFMIGGIVLSIIDWVFWPIAVVATLYYAGQKLFSSTEA